MLMRTLLDEEPCEVGDDFDAVGPTLAGQGLGERLRLFREGRQQRGGEQTVADEAVPGGMTHPLFELAADLADEASPIALKIREEQAEAYEARCGVAVEVIAG